MDFNKQKNTAFKMNYSGLMIVVFFLECFFTYRIYAQTSQKEESLSYSDQTLVTQFIKTMGNDIIVFDYSNIKQYWVDNSIFNKDEKIIIVPEKDTSKLFKVQLANVADRDNCKISILSETSDIAFTVFNKDSEKLSSSSFEQDFLQYHIFSCIFPLKETIDYSFFIQFKFQKHETISIRKIVFSFPENQSDKAYESSDYERLLSTIERKGTKIDKSDIYYLLSKNRDKIYFLIPIDLVNKEHFFCHIYPKNKKDLGSRFLSKGFIIDIFMAKSKNAIVPPPPNSNSQYSVVQLELPSYPVNSIRFGQYRGKQYFWTLDLNEETLER